MEPSALRTRYEGFRRRWRTLSFYERFEQVVALVLSWLIAVIIVVAIWDLAKEVVLLAMYGLLDPLDHKVFQAIFGQIMTVLLIALLALARKLIILDLNEFSASTILALAAVMLALGITYWLMRDQDVEEAPMSG